MQSKNLPGGNYADKDQRYMEGADPERAAFRDLAIWKTPEIGRQRQPEGADGAVSADGISGLLTRTVYPEVPPRVEYTLTELGYSLKPVLDAMQSRGVQNAECVGYGEKTGALFDGPPKNTENAVREEVPARRGRCGESDSRGCLAGQNPGEPLVSLKKCGKRCEGGLAEPQNSYVR